MRADQARIHLESILADISGDDSELGIRFPDLRTVEAKIHEFVLLAAGVPVIPEAILKRLDADPRFATNSRKQRLNALHNYVTTALRFVVAAGEAIRPDGPTVPTTAQTSALPDVEKVFIVHGRNSRVTKDLFGFLRSLHLKPIEWSEAVGMTGKASPYIGEVLDAAFSAAQAIVILLTPDDEVRLAPELWSSDDTAEEREIRRQPRPNVLFEAGMALGRNADRTLLIEVGRVKEFSDVAGRHVVRLTNDPARRKDVADRLRRAGCSVSLDGAHWLSEGDFSVSGALVEPENPGLPNKPKARRVVEATTHNVPPSYERRLNQLRHEIGGQSSRAEEE